MRYQAAGATSSEHVVATTKDLVNEREEGSEGKEERSCIDGGRAWRGAKEHNSQRLTG